jgi:signal transduction histidine kinase
MELALKQTDLRQLVEGAVEDFKPSFEQAGQVLTIDDIETVVAEVDENALRMVIDNLLENAKKYSETGAETSVSMSQSDGEVVITIRDQGVGVEQPDRLFQKFSRIANKLSNEVGGTGLGLYWAQSITRLHGGDLQFEENTPNGSQFSIRLPIAVTKITRS